MRYAVSLESSCKSKILSAAKNYDMIVVDAQDFTAAEIRQLKSDGAKVLSYINVGAVESDRSYFNAAKSNGLLICQYDNWPGEYWVKAQATKWFDIVSSIADDLAKKGIDGYWVDNLDVYYMADEEWNWKSTEKANLYNGIIKILTLLHSKGYVMINGGDVFVTKAIKDKKAGCFDAVNQETVISSITDYDPPGKFGRQASDENKYFDDYLQQVRMSEKDVFLLEYTKDKAVIADIEKYARAKGYNVCISGEIELGKNITTIGPSTSTEKVADTSNVESTGGVSVAKYTVFDLLTCAAKFEGSATVNEDVAAILKKYGHSCANPATCTKTLMAMFYSLGPGGIDIIGGYASNSAELMKSAKAHGLWHEGSKGIMPGDIVVFGRSGKTNHTELAIGNDLDVSGNYKVNGVTGCFRRTRSSHSSSIFGYVRPKYTSMGKMNNLQYTVVAVDCMLGVYGSGDTRSSLLSVFGKSNITLVQDEINRVWKNRDLTVRDIAIYTIAGYAGKNSYRKKRLGSWADEVQAEVNEIYKLHGKSVNQAAQYVIADKFGKDAVRTLLLKFCGYDAAKVQTTVNKILADKDKKEDSKPAKKDTDPSGKRIRVWPIWFFESDEGQFGDATAIIQYGEDDKTIEHVVLIDTAKKASDTVKKLRTAGITKIDAVVISHAHGDHYGALSDILEHFDVKALYLPGIEGLTKYQKSYASAMQNQEKKAKKKGIPCEYMTKGSKFTVGDIECKCVYQVPASKLDEHDDHHFVNNQSTVLMFTLGEWKYYTAGDCQNEANAVIVKEAGDIKADIFKCQWHGDRNAISRALAKAVSPLIGFSNYHHKERSGRGGTREVLEDVGAVVARNSENGDIYIDCKGKEMKLSCSKKNLSKKFVLVKEG